MGRPLPRLHWSFFKNDGIMKTQSQPLIRDATSEYSFLNHQRLTHAAPGIPYGSLEDMYSPEYSYDEDNEVKEEEDVDITPKFVTETMNLVVTEGDTIVLPCVVTR